MITEKEIINKYLGIDYIHKGRDLKGLDCWGLVISIYKDLGIEIFDLEDYERNWHLKGGNIFIENYYNAWVQHTSPIFLDVLLFNSSKGITNHAGIYLKDGRFIHGSRAGVVVTRLEGRWKEKLYGVFRWQQ